MNPELLDHISREEDEDDWDLSFRVEKVLQKVLEELNLETKSAIMKDVESVPSKFYMFNSNDVKRALEEVGKAEMNYANQGG